MFVSYYEGLSCPVCAKPFTQDEDIVVCPQCGLPHHRACWKSVGQCYAHDKHGTAQQWDRNSSPVYSATTTDANVCPKCATENSKYAEFCSRCGNPLTAVDWHSNPVQYQPPVPEYAPSRVPAPAETFSSTENIGGVAADELAAVVSRNANYYVPRFRRLANGESGGWNWAAFLLTPFWLFYRKQYLLGIVYFCVLIPVTFALFLISSAIPATTDLASLMEAAEKLAEHSYIYPCMLVVYIYIALMVLLALKGNAFYFSQCKKKIAAAKMKTPDITVNELATTQGVSTGMAILLASIWYIGVYGSVEAFSSFFSNFFK